MDSAGSSEGGVCFKQLLGSVIGSFFSVWGRAGWLALVDTPRLYP